MKAVCQKKNKSRLVESLSNSIDFYETYAPVAKLKTVRVVCGRNSLFLHQIDIKTTFLHGNLKEDIYTV